MFKPCGALLTDFYKQCHAEQYDPSITKVVSYYVPRKTRIPEFDKVVVFGIQAFIEEYLIEYMNETFFGRSLEEVIAEYEFVISSTMGADRVNSDKIKKLHELGYLPIEIWALPCCPSWNNLPFFLTDDQLIFNFVYRSYLTRHGKGPVGDSIFKEINNPYETNLNNPFQGEFQTYEFNKELVLYGIDHVKSHFNPEYKVRLIETCCDICAGHDLGIPYNYSIKTCKKNFDSVCK